MQILPLRANPSIGTTTRARRLFAGLRPRRDTRQSPSRHKNGSRNPVINGSDGGSITGVFHFSHVRNSRSFDVARHCTSRKFAWPSRSVARSGGTDFTPVYRIVAVPRSSTALPVKHPSASSQPGVGASAIGKCFQRTMSSLIAWFQCMSPQTAAFGLYWKNMWYLPFQ